MVAASSAQFASLSNRLNSVKTISTRSLRKASHYSRTLGLLEKYGINVVVLNQTPPLQINLKQLESMDGTHFLSYIIPAKQVRLSLMGSAVTNNVESLQRFIEDTLQKEIAQINIVDVDSDILAKTKEKAQHLPFVNYYNEDASNTTIPDSSQDIVIHDHLGNCTPPRIYLKAMKDAYRILKPSGILLLNITTHESFTKFPNRKVINHELLRKNAPTELLNIANTQLHNFKEIQEIFPTMPSMIRGYLLEIQPSHYIVYSRQFEGHAEWFTDTQTIHHMIQKCGFSIITEKEREGFDSHRNPLYCLRHNYILRRE